MSDGVTEEIERLHVLLAEIYRRGPLTTREQTDVNSLWARIERMTRVERRQ